MSPLSAALRIQGSASVRASAVAVQGDGKIVIAGTTTLGVSGTGDGGENFAVGQGVDLVGRHVGDNGFTCTTGVVSTTTRRMAPRVPPNSRAGRRRQKARTPT